MMQFGGLDLNEIYYVPASNFYSREIEFTVRKGQDALRVLLARSNAHVALLRGSDRRQIATSKPIELGSAQLLVQEELAVDQKYILVVELSEKAGVADGAALSGCEHFPMQIKTWDSHKLCTENGSNLPDSSSVPTTVSIDQETSPQSFVMSKRVAKPVFTLIAKDFVDLTITIDYSDAFYRTDLVLRAAPADGSKDPEDKGDEAAVKESLKDMSPTEVDYTRK